MVICAELGWIYTRDLQVKGSTANSQCSEAYGLLIIPNAIPLKMRLAFFKDKCIKSNSDLLQACAQREGLQCWTNRQNLPQVALKNSYGRSILPHKSTWLTSLKCVKKTPRVMQVTVIKTLHTGATSAGDALPLVYNIFTRCATAVQLHLMYRF